MTEISKIEHVCGNVVISIKNMMKQLPPDNEECSVYRVPKLLRKMNKIVYTPHVISIGPFHYRSRKDLIATEKYKFRHCNNFLKRLGNKMNSLELLVKTTQSCMEEARNCYAEPINMSDEEFVKMMLVDSCFVVEFFLRLVQWCPNAFYETQNNLNLSLYQRSTEICIDLIMLENQVPFFVLECLFDHIPQKDTSISFINLTKTIFECVFVADYSLPDNLIKPKHFVHILSSYFTVPKLPQEITCKNRNIMPPSIVELYEAGVSIKKAEDAKCVMDISFENGIFTIPSIVIDDFFETVMRNLIAFEHFSLENESKCIEYIAFMDDLISTEKDVNLLVKYGIIINKIGGSDKEISRLFNNLGKFVELPNVDHFNDISDALKKHCNRRRNKAKASLKHNYFNTPWTIVSFFAATFLIVLALLQTIFSGISAFQS